MVHSAKAGAATAAAVTILLFSAPPAQAYSWWGYRAMYGVGDWGRSPQYYWIDGTASTHVSRIDTAMSQWVNTKSYVGQGNPVVYYKTGTKSSSRLDVYQTTLAQSNWCAVTEFYVDTARIAAQGSAPTKNWAWSKILISGSAYPSSACGNKQGIIAHEMGHAFGLAHNSYTGTLMYSGIAGTSVTRAQLDDVKGVTWIYG